MKKKHKLVLIAPSGKEYKLGFLAPSKDGFIIGTPKLKEIDTSHLTVYKKDETILAHITPQEGEEEPRYFEPLEFKRIEKRLPELFDKKSINPIDSEEMSNKALYITKKFEKWYNTVQSIVYQKKISSKIVIHILNFKNLMEKAPPLVQEFTKSPSSYLGICKISQILENESIILGITETGLVIVPFEGKLYSVNFSKLTSFSFKPNLNEEKISTPLDEILQGMGLPQYFEEVEKKRFLEKLLSNEKMNSK
jgi:hypothetical protein